MRKIVITGATGMIGQALYREFRGIEDLDIHVTGRKTVAYGMEQYSVLDLLEFDKVDSYLSRIEPDIIIHCAAIANLDYCENNKEESSNVNVEVTKHLVKYCKNNKCKFIFISTDAVFDGKKERYYEEDEKNPVTHYGRTKFISEKEIEMELDDYLILRTTAVFGNEIDIRNNFVSWVIESLKNEKKIEVLNNEYRTSIYNVDFAKWTIELILLGIDGVVNVTYEDWLSRYEFAKIIAKVFDLDSRLISPSETLKTTSNLTRAKYGGFYIEKLKMLIGDKYNSTEDGLRSFKRDMENMEVK